MSFDVPFDQILKFYHVNAKKELDRRFSNKWTEIFSQTSHKCIIYTEYPTYSHPFYFKFRSFMLIFIIFSDKYLSKLFINRTAWQHKINMLFFKHLPCILKLQLYVIHPVCMAERVQTPGLVSVPLLTLEETVEPVRKSKEFTSCCSWAAVFQ